MVAKSVMHGKMMTQRMTYDKTGVKSMAYDKKGGKIRDP